MPFRFLVSRQGNPFLFTVKIFVNPRFFGDFLVLIVVITIFFAGRRSTHAAFEKVWVKRIPSLWRALLSRLVIVIFGTVLLLGSKDALIPEIFIFFDCLAYKCCHAPTSSLTCGKNLWLEHNLLFFLLGLSFSLDQLLLISFFLFVVQLITIVHLVVVFLFSILLTFFLIVFPILRFLASCFLIIVLLCLSSLSLIYLRLGLHSGPLFHSTNLYDVLYKAKDFVNITD